MGACSHGRTKAVLGGVTPVLAGQAKSRATGLRLGNSPRCTRILHTLENLSKRAGEKIPGSLVLFGE
jgi:hypothetical protein